MTLNDVDAIRAVADPLERVKSAHVAIESRQEEVDRLSAIRRDAIEACITDGMRAAKVAEALGISPSRVSQLRSAGAKAQRAFFGASPLTIALGSKPEHGRRDDASKFMVSKEAMQAFEALAEAARGVGLDAVSETVPPPGMVDLNRPNLVVLCSPRLLPFIGQVLAADPHLGFSEDSEGWFLIDKTTATEFRSPRDSGRHEDFGYVGRLPRPDGGGTFLYVAGIHAEGTLGSAQWLATRFHDIYKELKVKRFSALIRTEFNPDNGEIINTELATPLYKQDT